MVHIRQCSYELYNAMFEVVSCNDRNTYRACCADRAVSRASGGGAGGAILSWARDGRARLNSSLTIVQSPLAVGAARVRRRVREEAFTARDLRVEYGAH
jgi:hypothetical protein